MGFLTKGGVEWVRYTDRTALQTTTQILATLGIKVPEITDHSKNNPLVRIIDTFGGIAELLHYYVDFMGREATLDGARLYSSLIRLSKLTNYRVAAPNPAGSIVTLAYSSTSTTTFTGAAIPSGTIFSTDEGVQFVSTVLVNIPAATALVVYGEIPVIQIEAVPSFVLAVSTGAANQEYTLTDEVAGLSAQIIIAALGWVSVETFAYSTETDKHFIQTVNEAGQVLIKFGDGINGEIPTTALDINISYNKTIGEAGNVAAQTITTIVSVIPTVVGYTSSATNNNSAASGKGVESIEELKRKIPLAIRTKYRAVTKQDFIDLGLLVNGVEAIGVVFGCGKKVELYIVPVGGGIAPPSLLNDVVNYFEDKRIITTQVIALSAGELTILLDVEVTAQTGFQNSLVEADVLQNLLDFFAPTNQEIGGSVKLGNIYEVVENTEGVAVSKVTLLSAVPYARPSTGTTTVLNWSREVLAGSTSVSSWEIVIVSGTTYQLFQDNTFINTYTIGNLVTLPEIEFTINAAAYSVGNKWTFISYEYSGQSIILQEPSIPAAQAGDINITVTGGI